MSGLKRARRGPAWRWLDGLRFGLRGRRRVLPTAGLPGNRREADEACGLGCLEGAELRHFDEQSEGGYGRDAGNAGEDCEPLGEIGVSSDLREDCRLDRGHLTNALWPLLSLAKRRMAPSASRWASRWSFEISTPMVSFCIFSAPLLVIRGSPPSIRAGRRKRRGRSNSSSTRQTVSTIPIRPSPLSRGLPPSPSGSFSPLQREKS